jgi:hypothetical protein
MSGHHAAAGRKGAHASWARTVDRQARLAPARNASPNSIEWHLARLGAEFDGASRIQREEAAESARRAYMADLAMRSAKARRRVA